MKDFTRKNAGKQSEKVKIILKKITGSRHKIVRKAKQL